METAFFDKPLEADQKNVHQRGKGENANKT